MDKEAAIRAIERYMSEPGYVAGRMGLGSIADALRVPGVRGVTRWTVEPSFERETVFTLVHFGDRIEIEAAEAGQSVWNALHRRSGSDDTIRPTTWRKVKVRAGAAPMPFRSWAALRAASEAAPSCYTLAMDGTGFWYELAEPNGACGVASWSNPEEDEHPMQVALINSYRRLLGLARLVRPFDVVGFATSIVADAIRGLTGQRRHWFLANTVDDFDGD